MAAHTSVQEEDDHRMTHPGTSSTRRRNRIGSEVVRRSSDERLNCFFLCYILYYTRPKTLDILFTMDLCMLYDENFILVIVVFICSRICPFLL